MRLQVDPVNKPYISLSSLSHISNRISNFLLASLKGCFKWKTFKSAQSHTGICCENQFHFSVISHFYVPFKHVSVHLQIYKQSAKWEVIQTNRVQCKYITLVLIIEMGSLRIRAWYWHNGLIPLGTAASCHSCSGSASWSRPSYTMLEIPPQKRLSALLQTCAKSVFAVCCIILHRANWESRESSQFSK